MNLSKRACSSSQLYLSPNASSTFDASSGPITFTWDTSCYSYSLVDLTLYAPGSSSSRIKVWESVDYSTGTFSQTLLPKWWNSTTSVNLQMVISASSSTLFPWLSAIPAGPMFTVIVPAADLVTTTVGGSTVAAKAADTSIPDPVVVNMSTKSGSLPAGKLFTAVFFPILIVVAGILVYVKWTRMKQAKKRQRWSQAVDNRMSVISNAWTPTAGQPTTPRKSGTFSQNRRTVMSSYSNHAGFGTHQAYQTQPYPSTSADNDDEEPDPNSFARPRTTFADGERSSRVVSFAEGPGGLTQSEKRGTVYSTQTRASAYSKQSGESTGRQGSGHLRSRSSISLGGGRRPTVGLGMEDRSRGDNLEMTISPDQSTGPWVLGDDDLVDHVGGQTPLQDTAAFQMMDRSSFYTNEAPTGSPLMDLPKLQIPAKAVTPLSSPGLLSPPSYFSPTMAESPLSPDEMLKAYATKRDRSPSVGMGGQQSMARVWEDGQRKSVVGDNNPFRASMIE